MSRWFAGPRAKLTAALVAMLLLVCGGTLGGAAPVLLARLLLGAAALAGLGWWLKRRAHSRPSGFTLAPGLAVLARTALSARSACALIEADGQRFLIVHGDGFAEIALAAPVPTACRRPPTRRLPTSA
ncbi:MAG: hypothetical protein K1X89_00570 [Myxococcaceae bacterium]|nr:hypothetical protein [Myxococcaceae bacterium]